MAGFDLKTGQVVYAAGAVSEAQKALLLFPARFDGSDRAYNAYKKNWAPRLGLAWRPFGGNRTVVKSGYGIFYTSPRGGETAPAAQLAPWLSYLRFSEGNATTPLFFDQVPAGINEGVFTDPVRYFQTIPIAEIRIRNTGIWQLKRKFFRVLQWRTLTWETALRIYLSAATPISLRRSI